MAGENNQQQDGRTGPEDDDSTQKTPTPTPEPVSDAVKALIAKAVDEELASIKGKLNEAYGKLEASQNEVKSLKVEKRDRELEELRVQGKHEEAAKREVAEANERAANAEARVIQLTRDNELRSLLAGMNFRNQAATEMAYKDLVSQLVQNEQGVWVHRSGVSIKDAVDAFKANKDNEFLFAVKHSSGAGSGNQQKNSNADAPKGLFGRPIADVLADAEAGKLPHQRRR